MIARDWTRRRWLGALTGSAVVGSALALAGCGRSVARGRSVAPGTEVLALGDSLTYGTGAAPEESYPSVLAALTGWQVVNAGVPGDTSAQALARLPALLDAHAPALVLVSIGGNDFLRRLPDAETRANVDAACRSVLAAGAQAVLISVPRPTLAAAFVGALSDHPLYGQVAAERRLPLHAKGWAEVLADERLRADRVHANAAGYRRFAEGLHATVRAYGLLAAA